MMFAMTALGFVCVILTVAVTGLVHSNFKAGRNTSILNGVFDLALYFVPALPASAAFMLFVRAVQIAYGA